MEFNKLEKPQNDYETMRKLVVDQNLSVKQIANVLHISKKLVEIKIKEHGL